MSVPALEAHHLRREFGPGRHVAVDDVSLRIDAGEVLCLLGPNGAGKTTTVKMISTLLSPTSGGVVIDGVDAVASPTEARSRLGLVLGGERGFYLRASARDNLLFFADVLGVRRGDRERRVRDALDAVALVDRADDAVDAFSRGMRQRLHIARGLLNAPRLLLLDEPTNGLDPEIARDIRDLVKHLAAQGTGILLTTHYLAEAEQLATSLALIMSGKIVIEGDVSDVVARSGVTTVTTLSVDVLTDADHDRIAAIGGLGTVTTDVRDGRTHLRLPWTGEPALDRLTGELVEIHGAVPSDLVTRRATLEESYLALVTVGQPG